MCTRKTPFLMRRAGLSAQRIQGGRSVLGFFPPLPPVHTGSPTEIATPQMEREHLHGSHVRCFCPLVHT